jgi:hypothetical protein
VNAIEHVVAFLEGRATNHSLGDEAKSSLEIIVGFYISHYTGDRVDIPLESPLRDVEIPPGSLFPPPLTNSAVWYRHSSRLAPVISQ